MQVNAQETFAKALRNNSTNTLLTLIIIETQDGREHVAVGGMQLLTAIIKERGLNPKQGGYAAAEKIAFSSRDRVFRFTNVEAIALVKSSDSPEVKKEVRSKLGKASRQELLARFSRPNGFADIYPANNHLRSQYNDAIAVVCLENRIPVMYRCIDGALDLAP